MRRHWIWFAHRPGVSDRTKALLLRHFRDPEDIFYADSAALQAAAELKQDALEALLDKNLTQAEKLLANCRREGIGVLTYRDAAYPAMLKNISDPPMVLYYKGQLPDLDDRPVIAVVGTRKASAYGLTTAKRMGSEISRCGGVVVSGMAAGIDAMAMRGALTAEGVAVGVLGCGVDVVYPASNRDLFRDMERKGCLFSEFPPGTPPAKYNFPRRNRLMSGMSNGVLVVEAPEKSGALITAHHAAEQGRDVFTVPGNVGQPSCVGSNALLRQGGIAAATGWDVVGEYEGLYPDTVRKDLEPSRQKAYPDEVAAQEAEEVPAKVAQKPKKPDKISGLKKKLENKAIDKAPSAPYSGLNEPLPGLSEEEQAVLTCLQNGPCLMDDIVAQSGIPAHRLMALLTTMELKSLIRRQSGMRVARNK